MLKLTAPIFIENFKYNLDLHIKTVAECQIKLINKDEQKLLNKVEK